MGTLIAAAVLLPAAAGAAVGLHLVASYLLMLRAIGVNTSNRSNFERCALASGLITEADLEAARASLQWSRGEQAAGEGPPGDPADPAAAPTDQQLADRLVEMGKLNAWQAHQLFEGRTKFNLGPYRIIDAIGQGGMGQVFKAEHELLGRVVAIKVLPKAKSTPEAIKNFTNEIRNLARLDHPKLVRALDAGHDGNVYFLVTEYVPGSDLRKLVRRNGPLSMQEAAWIVYQVAEGLAHAHAQGMIHRDVKPANVLVTPDGVAKLSDLGLAGPLSGDVESDPRFGKIVGTADYLSPDHIKAPWNPTPAWDIYSLGCTLYYAVTGKVPYPGGTTADKARAHCELRPLDPRRLNPELDDEFVDLMADMMAKDPARRVPSAEAVMERLAPWLGDWPVAGGTPMIGLPPRRRLGSPGPRARNVSPLARRVSVPPPAEALRRPTTPQPHQRGRPIPVLPPDGGGEVADTAFSGNPANGGETEDSASLIVQTTNGPPVPPPLPGQWRFWPGAAQSGRWVSWHLVLVFALLLAGLGVVGLVIRGLMRLAGSLF